MVIASMSMNNSISEGGNETPIETTKLSPQERPPQALLKCHFFIVKEESTLFDFSQKWPTLEKIYWTTIYVVVLHITGT
jgi:hypothetical protein